MNTIKTFLLLAGLTALFLWVGERIGGQAGLVTALGIAALMNLFAYWFSDKMVLMMYGAKPVTEAEEPVLYRIIRKLTQEAGLPMPRLYMIDSPVANAFATGRNPQHAAVAVTRGIRNLLNERELAGVIGHELAHVRNRDILTSTIAATIAGAVMMLARMAQWAAIFGGMGGRDREERGGGLGLLVVAIIAPLAAMIIQLAISRSREYQADVSGSQISKDPLALASALQKLEAGVQQAPGAMDASPATAHLFIVNPLRGQSLWALFSTHPPIPERIRRLEHIARSMSAGQKA
ncbi:MAG: zinc metalloprotease HtpX [Elusimicrobia bacterium]|nr:zinc metalloprotease HtpX [Elusimicrobiota bacterium]